MATEAAAEAGKLLVVGFEAPELDAETRDLLDEVAPLGTILFARNMPERDGLLALTSALRERDPAAILAIDHEGGRVDRLPEGFTRFPPALVMARAGEPGLLREVGRAHARELRAAGFNVNFAPVIDINSNPENSVIGDRAFGATPEEVVHNALPYLQGLAECGILGCVKHFPGHGDTSTDSHLELPVLPADSHPTDRLRAIEMKPFARAVSQGVSLVMTAHVLCPALDAERPATLSHEIIDGCLRRSIGYQGVIVSDDLEMKAVADNYSVGEAAVMAVEAGCDLLLVCRRAELVREAHRALTAALEEGRISAFRAAQTAKRRGKLLSKLRKLARVEADPSTIGALAHTELAARLA